MAASLVRDLGEKGEMVNKKSSVLGSWGRVHDVQNLIFLKMINAKKMNCGL